MELKDTTLGKIKELVDGAVEDYLKAQKGNKAAGTRARKALHEVKTLAHVAKKEILQLRKPK